MRFLILFFFFSTFAFGQGNAFKTFHTSNNFDDLEYKDAFYKSNVNQQYHASAFDLNMDNVKLSGINITFRELDLHQVDSFFIKIYDDDNGMPGQVIHSEDIHKYNYLCNQMAYEDSLGKVIDFFFRNPVYLNSGEYWIAFYASLTNTATEQPKVLHCSSASSYKFDGTTWTQVNSTIKYSLYGVGNFTEPISAEDYHNGFGAEELDGWVFSDLFPEGILGFQSTNEVYAETDDNTACVKMSSDYSLPFHSQMFYNLTSPKFQFLANHTYAISISMHPAVYPSGRHFPVFSFVFVPDPPALGFLEQLPGNLVGTLPSVPNMDSLIHNDNFYKMTHYYTPTQDIETRIAIHTELGAIPQGETADYWLDDFSIQDTTQNLSTEHIEFTEPHISPNPVQHTINVNTKEEIHTITLFNLTGEQIKEHKNSTKMRVDELPKGMYIVKVKTTHNEFVQKLIKE